MLTFTLIPAHATSIKHLTEHLDCCRTVEQHADYMGGYGDQPEGEYHNLTIVMDGDPDTSYRIAV